jgi:hypothetical protein
MKLKTVFLGLLLLSGNAPAQKPSAGWNWYFVAFCAPTPPTEICTRFGTATVSKSARSVNIEFRQKDYPEMHARFTGSLSPSGAISGVLAGFFSSGSETLGGAYRQMGKVSDCLWQEIALRSSVPDGLTLVLTKMDGPCR